MENGHAPGRAKSPSGGGLRRRLSVKMQRKETVEVAGKEEVPVAVVEQRVSNLAQGCLCEPSQLGTCYKLIDPRSRIDDQAA